MHVPAKHEDLKSSHVLANFSMLVNMTGMKEDNIAVFLASEV